MNPNFLKDLRILEKDTEFQKPNYSDFIDRGALRRLSPILRMGLTAAKDCQNQVGSPFDSIVIGTALGCLADTEKFLSTFITFTGDFLPPTSFIQSTHNTIGGQISLALKNHSYNMTHTQNSLSFEVSLMDALMCVDEGKTNVLVGSTDEKIDFLGAFQPQLIADDYPLSSLASFCVISSESTANRIGINKVAVVFSPENSEKEILEFLKTNHLAANEIDMILHSDVALDLVVNHGNAMNYLNYSGMNYSASAFATHLAHDYLQESMLNHVLIINNLCDESLGLILISKEQL